MKNKKVLITGATGCVGQYTSKWLLENTDYEILLLFRDISKLKAINPQNPRVKLLIGDLREVDKYSNEISQVTDVIHTATAWGDPERAHQVNIIAVKKLISLINPMILNRFIYFSTASVLDEKLEPLLEAKTFGTEYIRTKAQCLEDLEKHPLAKNIIAVFPTLVFGGTFNERSTFPMSYLTEGLKEAINWLWLARWFKVDSKFHFIHALDIAFMCGKLLESKNLPNIETNSESLQKLVFGQPPITINKAITTLLEWRGMRKTPGLPLWNWLILVLIKILPIKVNQWDLFSIRKRHFTHDPCTSPETFGGTSHAKTLNEILLDSGIPRGKNPIKKVRCYQR